MTVGVNNQQLLQHFENGTARVYTTHDRDTTSRHTDAEIWVYDGWIVIKDMVETTVVPRERVAEVHDG